MSLDTHPFAFQPWPADDGRASLFTGETNYQLMPFTSGNTYNAPYSMRDLPGAAFDAEFEALERFIQDQVRRRALANQRDGDWTTPTSNVVSPRETGLRTPSSITATGIPDNNNYASRPLDVDETGTHSFYDGSPTNEELLMLGGDTLRTSDLGSVAGFGITTPDEIYATSPNIPFVGASFPLEIASWPQESVDCVVDGETFEPMVIDDERFPGPGNTLSAPQSRKSAQNLSKRRMSNTPESTLSLALASSFPSLQQATVHQSTADDCADSHKRRKTSHGKSISTQNHIVTTELPWQRGVEVPQETSQSAFHTFSISGGPVEQKQRKPLSLRRLKELNQVRKQKACLRCRRHKVRVGTN
jgi:hypothetical protein